MKTTLIDLIKKTACAFTLLLSSENALAQVGSSLNFQPAGSPDFVTVPNSIGTNSLVGGNKITVEAWVNPSTTAGLGCIIGNYRTPSNSLQFLLRRTNNYFEFFVGTGVGASYTGAFSPAGSVLTNTWQHLAGVYDGTLISLYVNGSLSGTATANHVFAATTNSIILGVNSLSENFQGSVDEVRIWNTNRSQCQINTFKSCEIPTNSTNLVANYHFNQGVAASNNATVTTLIDATTNGFNGTLTDFSLTGTTSNWVASAAVVNGFTTTAPPPNVGFTSSTGLTICTSGSSLTALTGTGAATYTWSGGISNSVTFTAGGPLSYTVIGTAGGCTNSAVANYTAITCSPGAALNFTNSTPNIVVLPSAISTSSLIGGNKITVEAWVKPTSLISFGVIAGNFSTPNNNMQFLLRRNANQYEFYVGNSLAGGFQGTFSGANTSTLNLWQHVAGVYDGNTISLYINGVLKSSVNSVSYVFANTTNSITVGGNTIAQSFSGDVDELRIWNVNRTQCQINTFKDCEVPTSAAGLIANYHFNQGFANQSNSLETTLNDASGNTFNGTLSGFSLINSTSNWVTSGGVVSGNTSSLAPIAVIVSASPSVNVCQYTSSTLNASGANVYNWSGTYIGGGNSININHGALTGNASYTVVGTNTLTSCSNTTTLSYSVNPSPTVNIVSSASPWCVGQTSTLTASGANSYTWSTGINGNSIVVTPSSQINYTVVGTGSNNCNSQFTAIVPSICTSFNDQIGNNEEGIKLYPNPTSSILNIEVKEQTQISIINILGEIVKIETVNGTTNIDVNNLNVGVYFVKDAKSGKAIKFIKD
jgi:hypothetical protein